MLSHPKHSTGKTVTLCASLVALTSCALPAPSSSFEHLDNAIAKVDAEAFDAFNRCKDPEQLRKHASFFAPSVEFYHDTGGVTWDRAQMLANTKKNACGNYRRELVAGTLRVYPIKEFGAIAQGTHRFCSLADGKCEGLADFTIIWHFTQGKWLMTRVLSYGHRAATPTSGAPQ